MPGTVNFIQSVSLASRNSIPYEDWREDTRSSNIILKVNGVSNEVTVMIRQYKLFQGNFPGKSKFSSTKHFVPLGGLSYVNLHISFYK